MPARRFFVTFLTLIATMAATAGSAQASGAPPLRTDTPSGLPVPRFVSLKSDKTFCREGPSFSHSVKITFVRRGLPVMVVAETHDHWRKIRDVEGDECWTHKSKLSGATTVLVMTEGLILRAKPNLDAPKKARLGKGIVAKVETTKSGWLKISANGVKGWARPQGFWGLSAAELRD